MEVESITYDNVSSACETAEALGGRYDKSFNRATVVFEPPLEVKTLVIRQHDDRRDVLSPDERGYRTVGKLTKSALMDGVEFPFPFGIKVDGKFYQTGGFFHENLLLEEQEK